MDEVESEVKVLKEKGVEDVKALKDPEKTQLYKSIFRVKHDDKPRSRALGVLSNVFFHLHPAKINRDAVAYNYTWGMGGITFYLFVVLTFTGTLLMFYYHPTKVQAFRDILYLEHDVPFGKLLRNMHRWAAHLMIITVWLHMFRVFLTGSYKKPREFNWVVGVILMLLTLLLSFTGYLLPDDQLGFWAVTVGTNMARATPLFGHEGPFGPLLGMTPYNDIRFGLLGGSIVDSNALLRAYIWHCIAIPGIASAFHGGAFLARPQRRRHLGPSSNDAGFGDQRGKKNLSIHIEKRKNGRSLEKHYGFGTFRFQQSAIRMEKGGLIMDWAQLWEIASAPDNVPIVAFIVLVPFYTWYGLRQSFANDRLIAQLEADPQWPRRTIAKSSPGNWAGSKKSTSGLSC